MVTYSLVRRMCLNRNSNFEARLIYKICIQQVYFVGVGWGGGEELYFK